MSQTFFDVSGLARDRPTHYAAGTLCRTCCLFTDLHVATHYIRNRLPTMLPLLDGALSEARTLAHRILEFKEPRDSAAEASYGLPSAEQMDREARNWMLLGTNQRKPTKEVPMDVQQSDQSIPKAIADQEQNGRGGQQEHQRDLESRASEQDTKAIMPNTVWCCVVTLTNQSLEQQVLTLTVLKQGQEQSLAAETRTQQHLAIAAHQKTKRNSGMLWRPLHTPFVKQRGPWLNLQQAKAMIPSRHTSSWTLDEQKRPLGLCSSARKGDGYRTTKKVHQ